MLIKINQVMVCVNCEYSCFFILIIFLNDYTIEEKVIVKDEQVPGTIMWCKAFQYKEGHIFYPNVRVKVDEIVGFMNFIPFSEVYVI